jgi:hypothetical protein
MRRPGDRDDRLAGAAGPGDEPYRGSLVDTGRHRGNRHQGRAAAAPVGSGSVHKPEPGKKSRARRAQRRRGWVHIGLSCGPRRPDPDDGTAEALPLPSAGARAVRAHLCSSRRISPGPGGRLRNCRRAAFVPGVEEAGPADSGGHLQEQARPPRGFCRRPGHHRCRMVVRHCRRAPAWAL